MPGSDITPDLDDEGFLRSIKDWDQAVAKYLADQASIVLTEAHWQIIYLVREYQNQHGVFPPNRVLIKLIGEKLGREKASSIFLMRLFTGTPRRYLAMIAGLPKPTNCD